MLAVIEYRAEHHMESLPARRTYLAWSPRKISPIQQETECPLVSPIPGQYGFAYPVLPRTAFYLPFEEQDFSAVDVEEFVPPELPPMTSSEWAFRRDPPTPPLYPRRL